MVTKMRFLVIGLGSMGKRRIRNLSKLNYSSIAGFDINSERCTEVSKKYKIPVFNDFDEAFLKHKPDTLIVSTDPKSHMKYAFIALKKSLDCFIEASVVDGEKISQLAQLVKTSKNIIVPSCTMHYFPGPSEVRRIISEDKIGQPLNINYQTGQYLPDWHPWENINNFYVSTRETGGAREIVTFELTWLNEIFGDPKPISCVKKKISNIDADIDDIYHFCLDYPNNVLANITIEVVSRPVATRELNIIGSKGRLVFSGNDKIVKYISVNDKNWTSIDVSEGTLEKDYINPEEPYILEMADFLKSLTNRNPNIFPNNLEKDSKILKLLKDIEKKSK